MKEICMEWFKFLFTSSAINLVKAHGGELKVETKEGEGSMFTIQLSEKLLA